MQDLQSMADSRPLSVAAPYQWYAPERVQLVSQGCLGRRRQLPRGTKSRRTGKPCTGCARPTRRTSTRLCAMCGRASTSRPRATCTRSSTCCATATYVRPCLTQLAVCDQAVQKCYVEVTVM